MVFWGSQSGTAEGFANRLARDLHRRFGLEILVADLCDYDPATIALIPKTKMAIFIMSTYGEGDPSDNANELWSWVGTATKVDLSGLRYVAFGLGNKNYNLYNRVIDVVSQALDSLGAKALLPVGKADDSNGTTEEDFMEWKEVLFSMLRSDLHYTEKDPEYEPTLCVAEDDSMTAIDLYLGEPVAPRDIKRVALTRSPIHALPVKVARELFTTPTRNCLHIEVDLSHYPELKYKTGDHLGVWPTNPDIEVERLLKVLNLQHTKDTPISISSLDPAVKTKVPTPTTMEALFRYYLEICAPVSRELVLSLAQFAPMSSTKALLTKLGKDRGAYNHHLSRNHVTIGRLLESTLEDDASWESLPLSFLLEALPVMTPRYYSISSSSIVQPRQAAITAVVTQELLSNNVEERVPGLATNYMLALKQSLRGEGDPQPHPHGLTYALEGPNNVLENGKLHVHVRKSKFKLPIASSNPVVMVASGTGIAPFRGFLEERARLKTMGRDVGRNVLFFGCRNADEDYLYRDELQTLKETLGDSLTIVTAFSRQQVNAKGRRLYVQDRIDEHFADLSSLLLDSGAYFYICGSASMARDVSKRLGACFCAQKGWTDEQLRAWSEQQKRTRKWQEDVWG